MTSRSAFATPYCQLLRHASVPHDLANCRQACMIKALPIKRMCVERELGRGKAGQGGAGGGGGGGGCTRFDAMGKVPSSESPPRSRPLPRPPRSSPRLPRSTPATRERSMVSHNQHHDSKQERISSCAAKIKLTYQMSARYAFVMHRQEKHVHQINADSIQIQRNAWRAGSDHLALGDGVLAALACPLGALVRHHGLHAQQLRFEHSDFQYSCADTGRVCTLLWIAVACLHRPPQHLFVNARARVSRCSTASEIALMH